ncbi:MAG: HipA domain-containing protein [Clostridiales bacterium]|nr:HipA domain-containing protein [Clostridiales bacterium]
MNYLIMRKNDPITAAQFSEDGTMIRFSGQILHPELAPLQSKISSGWLRDWWKTRSVPISQGKISEMLLKKGLLGPEDYLVKNLGLSLTDYYWIKPAISDLTWKDVNLFDNDFRDNLLTDLTEPNTSPELTPNSSLQGQLEKTWAISESGDRILIKGNTGHLSAEGINEVIASELHLRQGYENHTSYRLIHIKEKAYDFGCYSKLFTNQQLELVSAYAVVTSEKQPGDQSTYEHFISVCGKYGMDTGQLRRDLEYQIMTDFILSNRDRHLSNISILRDANTLKFLRMAPIYDSGKSLFVGTDVPSSEKGLLRIQTQSFASSELKLLSYVTDRSLVDISKLPSPDYIRRMYQRDSQADPERTERIVKGYEQKISLFEAFQRGEDLRDRVLAKYM